MAVPVPCEEGGRGRRCPLSEAAGNTAADGIFKAATSSPSAVCCSSCWKETESVRLSSESGDGATFWWGAAQQETHPTVKSLSYCFLSVGPSIILLQEAFYSLGCFIFLLNQYFLFKRLLIWFSLLALIGVVGWLMELGPVHLTRENHSISYMFIF